MDLFAFVNILFAFGSRQTRTGKGNLNREKRERALESRRFVHLLYVFFNPDFSQKSEQTEREPSKQRDMSTFCSPQPRLHAVGARWEIQSDTNSESESYNHWQSVVAQFIERLRLIITLRF